MAEFIGFLLFPPNSKVENWRTKIVNVVNRKRKGNRSVVNRNASLFSLPPLLWGWVYTQHLFTGLQKSSLLMLGELSIFVFNKNCNKTFPVHWDLKPIIEKMAIEVGHRWHQFSCSVAFQAVDLPCETKHWHTIFHGFLTKEKLGAQDYMSLEKV